jgi:DNA uptake protein ComE-like DNA-binding protein
MKTPEENLCSRGWRLRHSAFLLWSILSFGMLTAVGFWVIALKSRRRAWWVAAVVWTVFNVSTFVVSANIDSGTKENPSTSVGSNVFTIMILVGLIGGITHSAIVRREWLRWRAYAQPGAWYAQKQAASAAVTHTHNPLSPAAASDVLQNVSGKSAVPQNTRIDDSGQWSHPHTRNTSAERPPPVVEPRENSLTLVDINQADSAAFISLGLDQAWADWLIATRTRIGGFATPEQLLTDGQMPPHVYAALRQRVHTPARHSPPQPPPEGSRAGRRLDL